MPQNPLHPTSGTIPSPLPRDGSAMPPPYTPIACDTHDRLEAMAIHRQEGAFQWAPFEGGLSTTRSRIRDIQVRNGAEYLLLWNDVEIRLDRLREVDGVPLDEVSDPRAAEARPRCG